MKHIRLLYCLIIMIILLSACDREMSSPVPTKITIGVSMASMKEDVFHFMKEAMYDNKESNNTEIIWKDAKKDQDKQNKDVDELIRKKVDGIIINPVDSQKSASLVKKIKQANIPVIALDRLIYNVKLDAYIEANNFEVGILQANYLVEQLKHKGKIMILKGDKSNNTAYEITQGNKEIFKKEANITIVAETWHEGWSPELAEKTVRSILNKHPDIKGIIANNSNMIMAAVKVLKEKNLTDKIITIGADANKEACLAIARGEHDADVDKMPYIQGLTAFKITTLILRGRPWLFDTKIKNGDYIISTKITPVDLIDKYNIVNLEERWPELKKLIYK
ncbi:substrate-binding domain-containing protein [Halocella sp. SP3-1]|uniref:sugar ABC transporter substrate-binding protein n=1 Tax=Halocella sp. SP3-1 TaxID=2382161 RepID=UPI000F74E861|nr:substrate-binding domain-containing protein [Halocella sp. SP3-1]AZO93607.1 sugar ABC transporter substrate-binding protein [Halocella sp. SP3-1]